MTRAQVLSLDGPAGRIEARLELPPSLDGAPAAFGVACHPHPLYGGTMDNKVTHVLARAMNECGAPCFRFNFRGVGASAGSFDNGRGEADDLAAVVAEGRRRFPGAALWLGGFSFGGFVALRGAETLAPQKLAAVAPAVSRLELGKVGHPDCEWVVIQGDADDVVPPQAVLAWIAEPPPARRPHPPRVHVLAGAGHFFHGRLHEVKPLLVNFFGAPAA